MPSTARAHLVLPSSLFLLLGLLVACGGDSDNGQEPLPSDPEPAVVTGTGEFPTHLVADGGTLFWSQAGETPIRSLPVAGGSPAALAMKIGSPDGLALSGADIVWLDDREGNSVVGCVGFGVVRVLRRTSAGGSATLAEGDQCYPSTGDLVLGAGAVFWVTSVLIAGDAIRRTPLAGGATAMVRSSAVPVVALAGDAQYLYWLETDFPNPVGAVRRMPLVGGPVETLAEGFVTQAQTFAINGSLAFYDAIDGQGVEGLYAVPLGGGIATPLTTVAVQPFKLAADETTLYWIEADALHAVPVGGGTATTLASVSGEPYDLLVRATDLLWSEGTGPALYETGRVRRVAKGGGAASTLADGQDAPRRLAMDATRLYWTEGGLFGLTDGFGRIARAPADGGAGETVVSGIASDSPPIAVSGDWVVVADKARLKRLPRGGGTVESVSAGAFRAVSVTTDGAYVYWVEPPLGSARRAPIGGGPAEDIGSSGNSSGPGGPIRVQGGTLVWSPRFDVLLSVPAAGGAPRALASGLRFVSDMVMDQTAVYWSEQDSGDILRLSLAGGTPTTVGPGQGASWQGLAQDGTTLYWIGQQHLRKAPKASGDYEQLFQFTNEMDALLPSSAAVDGQNVYWTEPKQQRIRKLPK
jgi:hypothetical protein